jgi:nucleoside-diphosphate-sugar epimerase
MELLVLGGTWFLGRALAEEALLRGHKVTTFNRGRSGADVPGVEPIRGDREDRSSLERMARGRTWDAVIDTSGFVPRVVRDAALELANRVDRYVFLSTVSVYQGWPVEPLTEDSPVLACPSDAGPDFGTNHPRGYPTRYGFQKAGCERAVYEVFDGHSLVLRPGVILGPYEYVGRLPWWLRRIARGGRVLAPGRPDRAIQPVDVRDVAAFVLTALEAGITGTLNVAAPPGHATYGSLLDDCVKVTGADARLVWVDDRFLLEHGVNQWTEIPLWRTHAGTWRVAADRARAAGLACRPLAETVRDTSAWLNTGVEVGRPRPSQSKHGIVAEKEAWLLAAWDSRLSSARPPA